MTEAKPHRPAPTPAVHPGQAIASVLEERHLSREELVRRTAADPNYVAAVLDGRADLTLAFAQALEHVLNLDQSYWLTVQARYNAEARRETGV